MESHSSVTSVYNPRRNPWVQKYTHKLDFISKLVEEKQTKQESQDIE